MLAWSITLIAIGALSFVLPLLGFQFAIVNAVSLGGFDADSFGLILFLCGVALLLISMFRESSERKKENIAVPQPTNNQPSLWVILKDKNGNHKRFSLLEFGYLLPTFTTPLYEEIKKEALSKEIGIFEDSTISKIELAPKHFEIILKATLSAAATFALINLKAPSLSDTEKSFSELQISLGVNERLKTNKTYNESSSELASSFFKQYTTTLDALRVWAKSNPISNQTIHLNSETFDDPLTPFLLTIANHYGESPSEDKVSLGLANQFFNVEETLYAFSNEIQAFID